MSTSRVGEGSSAARVVLEIACGRGIIYSESCRQKVVSDHEYPVSRSVVMQNYFFGPTRIRRSPRVHLVSGHCGCDSLKNVQQEDMASSETLLPRLGRSPRRGQHARNDTSTPFVGDEDTRFLNEQGVVVAGDSAGIYHDGAAIGHTTADADPPADGSVPHESLPGPKSDDTSTALKIGQRVQYNLRADRPGQFTTATIVGFDAERGTDKVHLDFGSSRSDLELFAERNRIRPLSVFGDADDMECIETGAELMANRSRVTVYFGLSGKHCDITFPEQAVLTVGQLKVFLSHSHRQMLEAMWGSAGAPPHTSLLVRPEETPRTDGNDIRGEEDGGAAGEMDQEPFLRNDDVIENGGVFRVVSEWKSFEKDLDHPDVTPEEFDHLAWLFQRNWEEHAWFRSIIPPSGSLDPLKTTWRWEELLQNFLPSGTVFPFNRGSLPDGFSEREQILCSLVKSTQADWMSLLNRNDADGKPLHTALFSHCLDSFEHPISLYSPDSRYEDFSDFSPFSEVALTLLDNPAYKPRAEDWMVPEFLLNYTGICRRCRSVYKLLSPLHLAIQAERWEIAEALLSSAYLSSADFNTFAVMDWTIKEDIKIRALGSGYIHRAPCGYIYRNCTWDAGVQLVWPWFGDSNNYEYPWFAVGDPGIDYDADRRGVSDPSVFKSFLGVVVRKAPPKIALQLLRHPGLSASAVRNDSHGPLVVPKPFHPDQPMSLLHIALGRQKYCPDLFRFLVTASSLTTKEELNLRSDPDEDEINCDLLCPPWYGSEGDEFWRDADLKRPLYYPTNPWRPQPRRTSANPPNRSGGWLFERTIGGLNPLPILLTAVLFGPTRYDGSVMPILQHSELSRAHLNYRLEFDDHLICAENCAYFDRACDCVHVIAAAELIVERGEQELEGFSIVGALAPRFKMALQLGGCTALSLLVAEQDVAAAPAIRAIAQHPLLDGASLRRVDKTGRTILEHLEGADKTFPDAAERAALVQTLRGRAAAS